MSISSDLDKNADVVSHAFLELGFCLAVNPCRFLVTISRTQPSWWYHMRGTFPLTKLQVKQMADAVTFLTNCPCRLGAAICFSGCFKHSFLHFQRKELFEVRMPFLYLNEDGAAWACARKQQRTSCFLLCTSAATKVIPITKNRQIMSTAVQGFRKDSTIGSGMVSSYSFLWHSDF